MKTIKFFLLTGLLGLLLVSCVNSEVPSNQRVVQLFRAIPNRKLDVSSKQLMTRELYDVLAEAYLIPDDLPFYMGSSEFLCHFVEGNGGCCDLDPKIVVENVKSIGRSLSVADVNFMCMDCYNDVYESTHKLIIQKVDGTWVLADFDSKLEEVKAYIKEQRKIMKRDQVIDNIRYDDLYSDFSLEEKTKMIQEYKSAVNDYFKMYP